MVYTNTQPGFGNHFSSEAIPNTLPLGQNAPQCCALGLYAEQLSGTAFTAPRSQNRKSWLYRILPSVKHGSFEPLKHPTWKTPPFNIKTPLSPNQRRWDPLPYPDKPKHFIDSIVTFAGCGTPNNFIGASIHLFATTASMEKQFFYNADGELLIVLQEGRLQFETEFGPLSQKVGEIVSIPRGVKFQVHLNSDQARGYILENFGEMLHLPELGPIGANGLANPRDFLYPQAKFFDQTANFELIAKFQGHLWQAELEHHPLDVVAWHGNLAPYKYDLRLFNTINTVSFDHPDPSIFTVLTSQTNTPGIANVDFVIFPERWVVSEHTFRPPYYHRNIMSEFMGLIYGEYDAKPGGFAPGGCSLHNCMSPHGPDSMAFEKGSQQTLVPERYQDTLAFMFESQFVWELSEFAQTTKLIQKDYQNCWHSLSRQFEYTK